MTKREASDLLTRLLDCQTALDKALQFSERLSVDHERDALVAALKKVIGDVLTETIMPIVSQHPELNPYDSR